MTRGISYAQQAYLAYAQAIGGKTPDGHDLPSWSQLAMAEQQAWQASSDRVRSLSLDRVQPNLDAIESSANIMNGAALVRDLPVITRNNVEIGEHLEQIQGVLNPNCDAFADDDIDED